MGLENLRIWVSPTTNTIYAGYINKDGRTVKSKVDVSKQVKNAMMQYMHQSGEELESLAGELKFIPKEE